MNDKESELIPIMNAAALIAIHNALATGVHGAGASDLATLVDLVADIATHAALNTGVHGVGGSTLQSLTQIAALIATHAGLPNVHHAPFSLTIAETEAFDGVGPVAYTDLDLSGIVGSNRALVLLKCSHTGGTSTRAVNFRINGDAEPTIRNRSGSAAFHDSGTGAVGYVLMVTDASGILEWEAQSETWVIDVVAYLK